MDGAGCICVEGKEDIGEPWRDFMEKFSFTIVAYLKFLRYSKCDGFSLFTRAS